MLDLSIISSTRDIIYGLVDALRCTDLLESKVQATCLAKYMMQFCMQSAHAN